MTHTYLNCCALPLRTRTVQRYDVRFVRRKLIIFLFSVAISYVLVLYVRRVYTSTRSHKSLSRNIPVCISAAKKKIARQCSSSQVTKMIVRTYHMYHQRSSSYLGIWYEPAALQVALPAPCTCDVRSYDKSTLYEINI